MTPRWPSLVLGVVCILVGAVWALQGAGLLAGSPMTGRTLWLVVGTVLVVVGLFFGYRGLARSARRV